jgi:hypothetical protein
MFTPRRCNKKKVDVGLIVRTFTGVDYKVICEIGERTDLKHVVYVKNLRAYETRVICSGTIAEPGLIRFDPPRMPVGNSDHNWTAEYVLGSDEEHTFPRVSVLSGLPKGEERKIDVKIEIDRLHRGTTESTSLQIFVKS